MAAVVYHENLFSLDFPFTKVAIDKVAMDEELTRADGVYQHPGINDSRAGITGSESQIRPHGGGVPMDRAHST
jgi:hypothetical protein